MKTNTFLSVFLAAILVVGLFGSAPTLYARAQEVELPIDPAFLQYAQEHPDDYFAVVVQKAQNNGNISYTDPEQEVEISGGRLKKELEFIGSFSAELTGTEIDKLSRHPLVHWISYDAPMFSTAVTYESFTTWATAIGTVTTNSFSSNASMVDSSLGSNATFGYGATVKGAFTGFSGQAVPGNGLISRMTFRS